MTVRAPSLDPEGRVVMVSGAARGLGRAVAEQLLEEGYSLSLGARGQVRLERAFADADAGRLLCCDYDALVPGAAERWVEATLARFGRIDGLVNNAGILRQFAIEDDWDDDLEAMWQVNVRAPMRLTRAALPHLRACGQGRVVNVSSLSGLRVSRADFVGYSMTKFALSALSHATRRAAFEDGVRCTNLCPSLMDTQMVAHMGVPPERMLQPGTVAQFVALLMALPNEASVAELPINVQCEAIW